MKALVVNAPGGGFDLEDVKVAAPSGREILVDATDVIDSTKAKPVEAVRDLLPQGADHVFDFVGLKAVAEQGLTMLAVGGGLYLVGVSSPEINIDLNIFKAIGGQKASKA
jgi:S-(hydroxymethyl)glutathione dehydrogenase/alcohol dehydrogenase